MNKYKRLKDRKFWLILTEKSSLWIAFIGSRFSLLKATLRVIHFALRQPELVMMIFIVGRTNWLIYIEMV